MVSSTDPIASLEAVVVEFRPRRAAGVVRALRGVTLDVFPAETLGVVGESGSGKTTCGRVLLGLQKPTAGEAIFRGQRLDSRRSITSRRGRLQVVLQNPDWSLNPYVKVWRAVAEPIAISGTGSRSGRRRLVDEMLRSVGLDPSYGDRRPHELSGGQRQRIAIARALISNPDLIVFDEAVTALDASVQTQVLNLIGDLQTERGFASVFISHDLAAVRYVSDRIAVFKDGEIVEVGATSRFYAQADHPYSRDLMRTLSAGPRVPSERSGRRG